MLPLGERWLVGWCAGLCAVPWLQQWNCNLHLVMVHLLAIESMRRTARLHGIISGIFLALIIFWHEMKAVRRCFIQSLGQLVPMYYGQTPLSTTRDVLTGIVQLKPLFLTYLWISFRERWFQLIIISKNQAKLWRKNCHFFDGWIIVTMISQPNSSCCNHKLMSWLEGLRPRARALSILGTSWGPRTMPCAEQTARGRTLRPPAEHVLSCDDSWPHVLGAHGVAGFKSGRPDW